MFDVIGIDYPCIDMLLHLRKLPNPNESMEVIENSWQGGGKVATGLVAAARLGLQTAIIGSVGDDIYGKYCVNDFIKHGINVDGLVMRKNSTTTFSVVISEEETNGRNILYKKGTAKVLALSELNFDYISNTRYLHLAQANDVCLEAAKYAKERGVHVVFDADSYSEDLENIFQYVDILIASEFVYNHYFHNKQFEKNLRTSMAWGPKMIVYTFGENGCIGIADKECFTLPAFKIPVVDTVGAGDVFHGAFIYGLCQNWSIQKVAEYASAVSAIKCTKIGGRAGIPTVDVVQKFIETGLIDYESLDKRVKFYERGIEYAFK